MKAVELAKAYIGVAEISGNRFIDDPKVKNDLGEILKKAGHLDGEAWCSLFGEAIFCLAYPDKEPVFRKLFSKGAVQTFNNFKNAGYPTSMIPRVGDLVVFQQYKDGVPSWQGHLGIVSSTFGTGEWISIEGNTNAAGSRESNTGQVAQQRRKNVRKMNGLNLLGFVTLVNE